MVNLRLCPEDTSLLTHYHRHRTQLLDSSNASQQLKSQRSDKFLFGEPEHPDVLVCLLRAGFYGCYKAGHHMLNLALLTAITERWHPETHTFHLPVGEATVTLQDVAVLWGLPVQGTPVPPLDFTRHDADYWVQQIHRLLGIMVPTDRIDASSGKLRIAALSRLWSARFRESYDDDVVVEQRARFWIFGFLTTHVFSDTSGKWASLQWLDLLEDLDACGQHNWGAAILAHMYHQLDMSSSSARTYLQGGTTLVQWWIWERIDPFRPTVLEDSPEEVARRLHVEEVFRDDLPAPPRGHHYRPYKEWRQQAKGGLLIYRDVLDKLLPNQFEWQPYRDIMDKLPAYCLQGREWWRTSVPLICGTIVEWHRPERVMRQFGMRQVIPDPPMPPTTEDHISGTERATTTMLEKLVERWADVAGATIVGVPEDEPNPATLRQYMRWYHQRTILMVGHPSWMSDSGGYVSIARDFDLLASIVGKTYHHLRRQVQHAPQGIHPEIDVICSHMEQAMQLTRQEHLLAEPSYFQMPETVPQASSSQPWSHFSGQSPYVPWGQYVGIQWTPTCQFIPTTTVMPPSTQRPRMVMMSLFDATQGTSHLSASTGHPSGSHGSADGPSDICPRKRKPPCSKKGHPRGSAT